MIGTTKQHAVAPLYLFTNQLSIPHKLNHRLGFNYTFSRNRLYRAFEKYVAVKMCVLICRRSCRLEPTHSTYTLFKRFKWALRTLLFRQEFHVLSSALFQHFPIVNSVNSTSLYKFFSMITMTVVASVRPDLWLTSTHLSKITLLVTEARVCKWLASGWTLGSAVGETVVPTLSLKKIPGLFHGHQDAFPGPFRSPPAFK